MTEIDNRNPYPVKAGVWRNLLWRLRLFIRQLRCKHTHTFVHNLSSLTTWQSSGIRMGNHNGLQLRGCYLCGHIIIEDYSA